MILTVIVPDGIVSINNVPNKVDLSPLSSSIHAIQWDGITGAIEYIDNTFTADGSRIKRISSIADYQWIIDSWQKINSNRILSMNEDALWQAAHDYEYSRISGSAIGLLTMGVLSNKPKSKAVQTWLTSLWNLYYKRKASLSSTVLIDSALLDFSSIGEIPSTVPDLMAEILV